MKSKMAQGLTVEKLIQARAKFDLTNSEGLKMSEKAKSGCVGYDVFKPWPDPAPGDDANPKDRQGVKKVNLGLLPAAGTIYGALAMENGASKYGPYNWRKRKVRMTVYLDAIERHLLAFRDGEDQSRDAKVPHLGHIIACAAILADAIEGGFVMDDRPTTGPAARLLEKYDRSGPQGEKRVSEPQNGSASIASPGALEAAPSPAPPTSPGQEAVAAPDPGWIRTWSPAELKGPVKRREG